METIKRRKIPPLADRFWKKVKKDEGCWEWQASLNNQGYGQFWTGSTNIGAHRFSFILTYGEIPEGLFACHRCDNPKCVKPEHLFLGTHADNMRDMHEKGRWQFKNYNNCGFKKGYINHNAVKTHCKRGHELAGENLIVAKTGARTCRTCFNISRRTYDKNRRLAMKIPKNQLSLIAGEFRIAG